MSWVQRQPGTGEGTRRTRLTEADLKELGLKVEPGINCAACGHPLDGHSDLDCITVFSNALKKAAAEYADAQEELEALREFKSAVEDWVHAKAGDRGERYTQLMSVLNSL